MLEINTFSPYILLYIGIILHSFLICSYVVIPSDYKPSSKKEERIYKILIHLGIILYFQFGVVFIYSAIYWLSGPWGYADWRYQLPAVVLIIVLGIQYILGMFANPQKIDIIYGIIATFLMVGLNLFIIPFMNLRYGAFLLLIIMLIVLIIYGIIWALLSKNNEKSEMETEQLYLWDRSDKLKEIFSRKVNIIIYFILIVETWLKLFGSSMLIWF